MPSFHDGAGREGILHRDLKQDHSGGPLAALLSQSTKEEKVRPDRLTDPIFSPMSTFHRLPGAQLSGRNDVGARTGSVKP